MNFLTFEQQTKNRIKHKEDKEKRDKKFFVLCFDKCVKMSGRHPVSPF